MKEQEVINGRYLLHESLGQGGMGIVHRATDRLTGEIIALKQVFVPIDNILLNPFSATQTQRDLRLTLATEFQLLASMHHPNIINVLDYGFNANKQPFFTMTYLAEAQTILAAANGRSVIEKVQLLIQTLEALAYLHRRGVLHRDLKPDNVLVVNNVVRVLDFGLAVTKDKATQDLVGSWLYVAPEVLHGETASEVSDLYTLGVIAYHLFAGVHPFDIYAEDVIGDILDKMPDMAQMSDVGEEITAVVTKLLAKKPLDRYPSAHETIQAFNQAIGQPRQDESQEIRESYLQAAKFVGRTTEMGQLRAALQRTMAGQGSAWLIGGESGVGKSRLLRELETQALVDGFLVLRGQAVPDGGGLPYQLWREALRHLLAITPNVDDLTASVLKPLVPDINTLLGRDVASAPALEENPTQIRLFTTIARLFQQQTQPILFLLEDLHWGDEGLLPLPYVVRQAAEQELLIIGNYRDDERPELPQRLPEMQLLPLPRLNQESVAALSVAMLGEVGQQADLLALLQKETEGNTFFLVEVVRALAEEAGQLAAIGQANLPTSLMPEGIQTIITRRLTRVPQRAQRLLTQAAVAGRQLDLAILYALDPAVHLDNWWLSVCAEAAVLEVQNNQWRFSHDKLRDGLLARLEPSALSIHHGEVAEAIEQAYADNPDYASRLAYHWQQANKPEKERVYAIIAGHHATKQFANKDAILYFDKALALTPESDWQSCYDILLAQEEAFNILGERAAQQHNLERLTKLASSLQSTEKQAEAALRQANYYETIGDYPQTISLAHKAVALALLVNNPRIEAKAQRLWGIALRRQGQYETAAVQLKKGLALFQQIGDKQGETNILGSLGHVCSDQGRYSEALSFFQASLAISRDIKDQPGECLVQNGLGIMAAIQGDFETARQHFQAAQTISHQIGDRLKELAALNNLGNVAKFQGIYDQALTFYEASLASAYLINDRRGAGTTLTNLGTIKHMVGAYEEGYPLLEASLTISREIGFRELEADALSTLGVMATKQRVMEKACDYLLAGLTICQEIGYRRGEEHILTALGNVMLDAGNLKEAEQRFLQALELLHETNRQAVVVENLAGLAYIALREGNDPGALRYVDKILLYQESNPPLDGAERPFLVLLRVIQVLQAVQDSRAAALLKTTGDMLLEQAGKITSAALRQSFLANVPDHQEIVRLQQGMVGI